MTRFAETDHPRAVDGKFTEKRNSAPAEALAQQSPHKAWTRVNHYWQGVADHWGLTEDERDMLDQYLSTPGVVDEFTTSTRTTQVIADSMKQHTRTLWADREAADVALAESTGLHVVHSLSGGRPWTGVVQGDRIACLFDGEDTVIRVGQDLYERAEQIPPAHRSAVSVAKRFEENLPLVRQAHEAQIRWGEATDRASLFAAYGL